MIKLYGFGPTRSLRALWTLRELGVEFDFVTVDMRRGEHRKPEFLAINPAGKLPALVDGDVVLTESIAIVLYLAEKHADRGLVPTRLDDRAHVYRWLMFAATELEQPLWRIARHKNVYPADKRLPADIPLAEQDFRDMIPILERHLDAREFLVGDRVTVADLVMGYTLDWANQVKLLEGFPTCHAYMERLYTRPSAPPRIAAALAALKGQ
jgi:glutathione S-transferase